MDYEEAIKNEFDVLIAKIEKMDQQQIEIGFTYPLEILVNFSFNKLDVISSNEVKSLASKNPLIEERIRNITRDIRLEVLNSVEEYELYFQKTFNVSIYDL